MKKEFVHKRTGRHIALVVLQILNTLTNPDKSLVTDLTRVVRYAPTMRPGQVVWREFHTVLHDAGLLENARVARIWDGPCDFDTGGWCVNHDSFQSECKIIYAN